MNPLRYKHDLALAQKRIIELEQQVTELERRQSGKQTRLQQNQRAAYDRHIKRHGA